MHKFIEAYKIECYVQWNLKNINSIGNIIHLQFFNLLKTVFLSAAREWVLIGNRVPQGTKAIYVS